MSLSDTDIKNIKETYTQMIQCMMTLDWDRFTEMCTDDMIHVTSDAHIFQAQGKKSLNNRLVEVMGGIESLEIEYSIREVNGDGNCAYVLSPNKDRLKFSGSDELLTLENCQTLSILERQGDNSWKMKLQMCIVPDAHD
jgi:ketosteroid isomerase-like protein